MRERNIKKRIKKFSRYELKIESQEKEAVLLYLNGDISSRELGKKLGYSHQQSINLIGQICRQWFQSGNLCYYETTHTPSTLPAYGLRNT